MHTNPVGPECTLRCTGLVGIMIRRHRNFIAINWIFILLFGEKVWSLHVRPRQSGATGRYLADAHLW